MVYPGVPNYYIVPICHSPSKHQVARCDGSNRSGRLTQGVRADGPIGLLCALKDAGPFGPAERLSLAGARGKTATGAPARATPMAVSMANSDSRIEGINGGDRGIRNGRTSYNDLSRFTMPVNSSDEPEIPRSLLGPR